MKLADVSSEQLAIQYTLVRYIEAMVCIPRPRLSSRCVQKIFL